jgi:acyl carrier protein
MNKEEIIEKTIAILADEFEVDEDVIQPDAVLKDTLGLDSLDYVDLVVTIETSFGVKLVEADFATVSTFQDFYNLIDLKLKMK